MMNLNPNIKTPAEVQPTPSTPDGQMTIKGDKSNIVVRVFFDHEHGRDAKELVQRFVMDRLAAAAG